MILVFGRNGQVASELHNLARGATFLGRDHADLEFPADCASAIHSHAPSAVINAAAYTAVDAAEDEDARANVINGDTPGAMALSCAELGIPFIQISTDYVFDGSGEVPFKPDDPVAPVNAYGRSKRHGEEQVMAAGGTYAILRTSWVFSAYGNNFVKTMLRLGAERGVLRVVADQIGGPTPARAIAAACLTMVQGLKSNPRLSGTYHFSGAPDVSWAGFARETLSQARLSCRIEDIASSEWPTKAPRPKNSRLDCSGLERFGLTRPDWRGQLGTVLQELGNS